MNRIQTIKAVVSQYQKPSRWRASWQLVNTIGSVIVVWSLIYFSLSVSWWLTIPLSILAGGLFIRTFIIFHDCGHGSFFKSKGANAFWGSVTGLICCTPYSHWKWEHSVHHATTGHLDRRGVGDIWTMTVKEFLEASRWKRLSYRILRNPFVLFVVAPIYLFVVQHRIPLGKASPKARNSVWLTNIAVVTLSLLQICLFGFWAWFFIQLTVLSVAGSCGVWLFYVQHQFEDAYWERGEDWDYIDAALQGSSFYKLPKLLQWFTGNIGFHHIHHLSSQIPNYNLERCHRSDPMFDEIVPLTFWTSLKTMKYRLWDEKAKKLISFRQLRIQRHLAEELSLN